MPLPTTVLLPGLDGTAELFEWFIQTAPAGLPVEKLALPDDAAFNYDDLVAWAEPRLPPGPLVLLGESFSGPLAVLLAARVPRVVGLILCATFVEPPLPSMLSRLPEFIWNRPPPVALVRAVLTNGNLPIAKASHRAAKSVHPIAMAARIRAVLNTSVAAEFQGLTCPVMDLRGGNDRLISSGCERQIRRLRPNTQFVKIRGPHLLLQTQPEQAWAHVAPFIASVATPPQPPHQESFRETTHQLGRSRVRRR